MKFRGIVFIIVLFSSLLVTAQNKDEKEFRTSIKKYPKNTQKVVLNIPKKAKRIRHYQETDGEKLSYESKFKFKKHWFSVEFNSNGIIEDIEKAIKEKELPTSVKAFIKGYLKAQSTKYDLIKIQEQYRYSSKIPEVQFLNSILENNELIDSNYEIIIALKIDKKWSLKEMTFDAIGNFMNARNLQPDSYEYIMY
jgi:hypothetical protein